MSDTPGEVTPPPAEWKIGRQSALATLIPLVGPQYVEETHNFAGLWVEETVDAGEISPLTAQLASGASV
jgi:hypothetical protein